MKRLAAALSALALATGCVVTTDECSRSISTDWTFLDADSIVWSSCASAGVTFVDIYLDGSFVDSFSCTSYGATVTGVGSGWHSVTVEGTDATGLIYYRDEFQVDASACGDHYVASQPAEGRVNLDYSTLTASTSWLWFSVHDNLAGVTAAAVSASSTNPWIFPYPGDVVFRLPIGTFSLDWMQQVSGVGTGLTRACAFPTFTVYAATTTVVSPPISLLSYATYPTCP